MYKLLLVIGLLLACEPPTAPQQFYAISSYSANGFQNCALSGTVRCVLTISGVTAPAVPIWTITSGDTRAFRSTISNETGQFEGVAYMQWMENSGSMYICASQVEPSVDNTSQCKRHLAGFAQ